MGNLAKLMSGTNGASGRADLVKGQFKTPNNGIGSYWDRGVGGFVGGGSSNKPGMEGAKSGDKFKPSGQGQGEGTAKPAPVRRNEYKNDNPTRMPNEAQTLDNIRKIQEAILSRSGRASTDLSQGGRVYFAAPKGVERKAGPGAVIQPKPKPAPKPGVKPTPKPPVYDWRKN